MLYKSNVLMYDRQSESLWSQIRREAVAGPMTGEKLKVLPSTLTTWKKWVAKYPRTEVLSIETGYDRDYNQDPYADYYERSSGLFSFFTPGPGEEEKALVVGIIIEDKARAYPLELLRRKGTITDTLAGTTLTVTYVPETDQIGIRTAGDEELVPLILYWFVWKGMYPETGLHEDSEAVGLDRP